MTSEPVLTVADLGQRRFAGTSLAVLGHPISHSLSPPMHNAALGALGKEDGLFENWRYYRFDVPPEELAPALQLLYRAGFLGLNLTVPHKVIAFPLVARVNDAARPIGAVNTLKRGPAGWEGYNTDGYGLGSAVREEFGFDLAAKPIILLGAGGAARGAAIECLSQGCPAVWIGNRSRQNLDQLLESLQKQPIEGAASPRGFDLSEPPPRLPAGALVINATSAGLRSDDPPPLDLARLPAPAAVFDMIYNPPETALLAQARRLGIPAANGLSMLVHQGAKSLEIWSGTPASRTAPWMSEAARAAVP
jgi:shikimate dehydrogenase